MKFSVTAAAAALLLPALAAAEDLLFIDSLEFSEYSEAIGTLGMTAKAVSEADWRAMSTADFAAFKAIVIADPSCGGLSQIQFLDDTKATWSPAVLGNMVLIASTSAPAGRRASSITPSSSPPRAPRPTAART
ncbi:hypothetical protein GP486_006253 [Trichoglossum hirsutum]|uniref:Uncharacterized protein n=1 Tax=Trichoglossum hirsutum TaxID=265104 RepID=A0A9P8IDW8_9PEZI|nr:hypothetical protein GP486_006253 [Trichoglossum hirsutum]